MNDEGTKKDSLLDLLIEFDEMGFEPTVLPPPNMSAEEYAAVWKNEMLKEVYRLRAENERLKAREKIADEDLNNVSDEWAKSREENAELRKQVHNLEREVKTRDKVIALLNQGGARLPLPSKK